MAGIFLISLSAIWNEITEKLSSLISGNSFLITILKIIAILILVYIIFLVIRAFFRMRNSFAIGKIAKSVLQINKKMDILIERLESIEAKSKPEKEKVEKEKSEKEEKAEKEKKLKKK